MFDSTLSAPFDAATEGRIPFALAFPFIAALSHPEPTSAPELDGTLENKPSFEDAYTRLVNEIHEAFKFARHTFCNLDQDQLELAFREAKLLAASRLFGAELNPNVTIDPYGEFTFYHRSNSGYVDIGVRGDGELSYHVRNDIDPSATKFDDYDWVDFDIPQPLYEALQALRRHL